MEVGTVYGGYYGAKGYEGVRKEEKRADAGFAGKVAEKGAVSPKDMTLDEYKAYFNEKMNSLYTHPSQRNMNDVIDITDAAYKRMQTDPEYEKKILDALAQNKAVNFGGNIPVIAYMHIDDTWEKCYGYTQGMKENVGYSGSSSAKKPDAGRETPEAVHALRLIAFLVIIIGNLFILPDYLVEILAHGKILRIPMYHFV